ncbi:cadherin repeat domain-containing protein, partial [Oceanobacter sp. 3_MG-2023]|uniref:cadherin repeat domain-containing protein n=1 Tax=Oceanobacter sp. 3_MG-2023 TaxID=3062622 RepID=UPI0027355B85
LRLFDSSASAITAEIQVNSYTTGAQSDANVTVLDNGNLLVSWTSDNQDGSEGGVYGQTFDTDGNALGSEFLINSSTDGNQNEPDSSALALLSIDENSGAGQVVYTATATDTGDISDGVTFSLSGDDAALFSINSSTGEVTLLADPDYETQSSYSFIVTATDGAGNHTDQAVTLDVNDLDETAPVFSSLSAGFIVTWTSAGQDGSSTGVYAQRYDLAGHPVGEEIQINSYSTNAQYESSVAVYNDGRWLVSYTSYRSDGNRDGETYVQSYDAAGNVITSEYAVNTFSAGYQWRSEVATLIDGHAIVVWEENFDGDIIGNWLDAEGNPVAGNIAIDETSDYPFQSPSVASLAGGGVVVAYAVDKRYLGYPGIYDEDAIAFTIYGADGEVVTARIYANSTTAGSQIEPEVTGLTNGGFVVVWQSENQDGSGYGIYAQRYDANGNTLGGEFRVNTETTDNQLDASITALEDGGFVVVWTSYDQDGSGMGVFAQRYDADGNTIGSEFQVNTSTAGNQSEPGITALANGGFIITWTSSDQDGDGKGVYAQVYDADGHAVGSEYRVNSYTSDNQNDASVAGIILSVAENSGAGQVVYTAVATDTDDKGTDTSASVTYSLQGDDASYFSIDAITGEVTLLENPDYETRSSYSLVVVATDGVGNQVNQVLDIAVNNLDEIAPVITSGSSVSVDENTAIGSVIHTVTADDSGDISGGVTFSLSGDDAALFSIDASTGDVSLNTILDAETRTDYSLIITVTDAAGNYSSQAVALTVNDLDESAPTFTSGAAGYVVSWTTADDSDGSGIVGQRYDANGQTLGDEFQINTTVAGDQSESSVTTLLDGSFIVVWTTADDGDGSGIVSQRFSASGERIGSETVINSSTTGSQSAAQVEALGSGGYVVVWTSNGQDGDADGVYARIYDADGNAISAELAVNSYTTNNQNDASVTALADGGFVVTWTSESQDGGYFSTYL